MGEDTTTGSVGSLRLTRGLAVVLNSVLFLNHTMVGAGMPVALQVKVTDMLSFAPKVKLSGG